MFINDLFVSQCCCQHDKALKVLREESKQGTSKQSYLLGGYMLCCCGSSQGGIRIGGISAGQVSGRSAVGSDCRRWLFPGPAGALLKAGTSSCKRQDFQSMPLIMT